MHGHSATNVDPECASCRANYPIQVLVMEEIARKVEVVDAQPMRTTSDRSAPWAFYDQGDMLGTLDAVLLDIERRPVQRTEPEPEPVTVAIEPLRPVRKFDLGD